VNIGNRTSVKSGDIRHIEHRPSIWHRYRCSAVGVTRRPGVSILLVCQCLAQPTVIIAPPSTADRVKHACAACVWSPCEISDLICQTPRCIRRRH